MREEGGIKVYPHAAFLCEPYPLFKVARLYLVAVGELAVFEYGVARVKIELLSAGHEACGEVEVLHQLLGRARLAGVVAGGLYSAGERLFRVEARNVVALPAVDGNRRAAERFYSFFGVNAEGSIYLSCAFVSGHNSPPFILKHNQSLSQKTAGTMLIQNKNFSLLISYR